MIELKPYQSGDHQKVKARDIFGLKDLSFFGDQVELLANDKRCRIISVHNDDEIIAVIGISVIGPGLGEVWSITSDGVMDQPVSFHKSVLSALNVFIDRLKLHRVQATVRYDFPKGYRWLKSLGFYPEGIMLKYDADGNDHILFARCSWLVE